MNFGCAALKLSQQYYDQLFDELDAREAPAEAGPDRIEDEALEISGELGSSLAATFVIENNSPTMAQPALLATPLVGPNGAIVEGAMLLFEPEGFELAPNQKQVITLRVPLDVELYEKGATYEGAIAFLGVGSPDRLTAIRIHVK